MSCGQSRVQTEYRRPNCSSTEKGRKRSGFEYRKECCPKKENEWVYFPFKLEGFSGSTAPVLPTNPTTYQARYYKSGNKLTVQYSYENQTAPTPVTGGSDGTGNYIFCLPSGFNYDESANFLSGQISVSFISGAMVGSSYTGTVSAGNFPTSSGDRKFVLVPSFLNGIDGGGAVDQLIFGSNQTPITAPAIVFSVTAEMALF